MLKRSIAIALGLIITNVSSAYAVIVDVKVPDNITEKDLIKMSDETRAELSEAGYKQVIEPMTKKRKHYDFDVVLNYVKDGKSLQEFISKTPTSSDPDGELNFRRGSTYWQYTWYYWTDDQWNAIYNHLINAIAPGLGAYYLGKRVYGKPFETHDVWIKRLPTSYQGPNYYDPANDSIYIVIDEWEVFDEYYKSILNHEMLHAFLDGCPLWDQFTEGMAEAGSIIIATLLYDLGVWESTGSDYINHNNSEYFSYFEFYDKYEFASPANTFWLGFDALVNLRYEVTSMVWWKMYAEDEDFFINFNNDLYDDRNAGHGALMDMAAQAYSRPTLEGLNDIPKWLDDHPILKRSYPSEGDNYYMIPVPSSCWDHTWVYSCHKNGDDYTEAPVVNELVGAELYDYNYDFAGDAEDRTNGSGLADFHSPYYGAQDKRYKIVNSVNLGGEITATCLGQGGSAHVGVPHRPGYGYDYDRIMTCVLEDTTYGDGENRYVATELLDARTGDSIWGFSYDYEYGQFYWDVDPNFNADTLPSYLQWKLKFKTINPPYERTIYRNVDKAAYFIFFDEYPEKALGEENVLAANANSAPGKLDKLSTFAAAAPSGVTIIYDVPEKLAHRGPARVEIYDLAGRKILTTNAGPAVPGKNSFKWDYSVKEGKAPNGIYIYRVVIAREAVANKLVVAR